MPTLTASIVISPIPSQSSSSSFQVTGTYQLSESTWTDELVYEDDHGANVPIASPAVQLGTSSWSFTHPALPAGTHTVSVKDPLTEVVVVSNAFTVGAAQAISANTPTGVVAGVPFTFTGTLSNFTTAPSLTYSVNGGTAVALGGVTATGWSTQLTLPTSGTATIVVTNGSISSNTVSVPVAPVTVTHVISPNPPVAAAGPNYIFYDTFTSLADITDTGGPPLVGVQTIQAGSGLTFTDSGNNVWSIVNGVALENGVSPAFSANVIELALVNNVVWQENTSNQWFSFNGSVSPPTWTGGNNPLVGGTNGSWMNHYAFGGSEFTLSANDELEYYASTSRIGWSPFTLQNGGAGPGLVITVDTAAATAFLPAHTPANPLGLPYNTGIIVSATETNGEPTAGLFSFQYGFVEIQALLPGGPGMWVGFGMYPFTGSGEIDIIETGGSHLTEVFSSIHSGVAGASESTTVPVTDYTKNRHIYGVNWTPNFITWSVDGNQTAQVATPSDFIGKPYYIELDIAIQGNAGLGFDGVPDATSVFPNQMLVDFVRVSQGTTTTGSTISAGAVVTFTGTLTGYTTAPSLTYNINNAPSVAMTGVTATGWSMQFNAPSTSGAYVIAVSDGTTTGSTQFQVGAAAKVITPIAPSGTIAGQSFVFQGALAGYTTIPALSYTLNGGTPVTMTGVSVSGWSMTISIPTAGSYTIVVSDGTGTSGTAAFVVSTPNTALRTWYQNPGMDGSFWVTPFASSANWITTGAMVTTLRGSGGSVNLKGNFSVPWVMGQASDPLVTVTDGTHSIVVHVPLGTIVEGPASAVDQSIGGADATQPYLIWSISGATINTGSVAASGSVITGTYGFAVQDGSGLMMVDAVTGAPGDNNSFGGIQDYELAQATANPNYVIQHMLAYTLDPSTQVSSAGPVWPLNVVDTSNANTGTLPQGLTIGIPANIAMPTNLTRGGKLWWTQLQQYGAFFYNVGGTANTVNFFIYSQSGLYTSLINDLVSSLNTIIPFVCILNYNSGVAGAQYSLATTKGAVAGSTPAFTPPPPLDLSPTGGVNVAPSTFGAWYPSGYNATPTNSTTTVSFSISPNAPTGAVVNAAFTFSGSLNSYAAAPTLTYSLDGGTATSLSGVTSTGWSTQLTITTSGVHSIVVTDSAHSVSASVSFNVSSGALPPPSPVTWNPSDLAGGVTLSNGNYTATAGGGSATPSSQYQGVRANVAINTAKTVLWEVTYTAITQDCAVGLANAAFGLTAGGGLGADANGIGAYASTGTGSQPAQTVYSNGAQLTAGNGVSTVAGGVITMCTNSNGFWFSNAAMRSTSGVQFNNSTTANPATGAGGFPISSLGATFYPVFNTSEQGGIAVLNDGTSALSSFASSFIAANPSVVTLSGQMVVSNKAISPATPSGVAAGAPFTFTGTLTGYTAAPSLTYSINGGSATALAGVTATGWSTTLTIAATGTDTITVTDGSVTGSTASFAVSASGGTTPTITGLSFAPASSIIAGSPAGTVAGQLTVGSSGGALTGVTYVLSSTANFNVTTAGQIQFAAGGTMTTAPVTLGIYAGIQGQGASGLYPGFSAQWDGFVSTMGRTPTLCTAYIDQSQGDPNGTNGWAGYSGFIAASFNSDTRTQASTGTIPHVGWPFANGTTNVFAGITAGTYDAAIQGALGAFKSAGFPTLYIRPCWEFNLPNTYGVNTGNLSAFIAAWQHFYTVAKAYASANGMTLFIVWCPNIGQNQNSATLTVAQQYPGNSFVDVVAMDTYGNPVNPGWATEGPTVTTTDPTQWYLTTMIAFGVANNKPIAFGEIGSSADSAFTTAYVQALAGRSGATIAYLAFWDVANATGDLSFTNPQDNQANIATLWKGGFGPGGTVTNTVTSGSAASVAAGSYALNVTVGATNAVNSPATFGITIVVTSPSAAGVFTINGTTGTLIGPNGKAWVGRGVALHDYDIPNYITNAQCQPITTMFPGINFVRVAVESYWTPSTYSQAIGWLTAQNIVVLLGDVQNSTGQNSGGGAGVVFTGTELSNELAWYTSVAQAFTSTYVWFGTDNEPSTSPSLSAMYTWQQQTYNAIRNTGNTNIIEMEQANPFQQGALGGVANNIFAQMHNIVFGPHYYSWIWNGQSANVSQATIYSSTVGSTNSQYGGIVQQIANIGFFKSLDGIVPVGCFETGPATTGDTPDTSGFACIDAVFQAVNSGNLFCFIAWAINTGAGDLLNSAETTLSSPYGTTVAAQIAMAVPAPTPSVPPVPGATPAPVGTTWYVNANTGNDGNNGTAIGTPFASLSKAASVLNSSGGDLVLVYNGNYAPFQVTGKNGSASRQTVIKAQAGQSPVVVTTQSTSVGVQFTSSSYVIFQGFEVAGINSQLTLSGAQGNPGASMYNINGIQIGQFGQPLSCHHVQVIGCYVHDHPQSGITAQACDYITVQGNIIVGNSLYSQFGGSGISIGVSVNFDTAAGYHQQVIGNLCHGNKMLVDEIGTTRISDGEGIIIDDNHNDQTNNVAYTAKTLVANNICYNNGSSGLLSYDSSNVDFINNTCYLNCTVISPQEIDIGASDLCNVWNNIVWASPGITPIANDSSGVQQGNQTAPVGPSTFGFNMVFGGNGTAPPGNNNIVGSNPNFVSATGFDFSLATGSAALGAGANSTFKLATDFAGNPRPGPNGYSLGAID